jgi:hypothetical protein
MTRDEFSTKYKLLGLLRQGEGPTYSAEHRSTGRAVLVHFLPVDSPTAAMLPDLLSRLGPTDAVKIIETLMVEGSPIVVSGPLDAPGSFEQWLRARAGALPVSGAPAAAASSSSPDSASSVIPAAAAEPLGGDFTQLFRPAEESPIGGELDRATPEHKPAAPTASGSFTALFQAGQVRAGGADKPLDASSVMKSAEPPPTGLPPAPPPAASFTELFRGSGAPDPIAPPAPGGSAGPSVPMRNLRLSPPASADAPPVMPPAASAPLPPPHMGATPPSAPLTAPVMHAPDLPAAPPVPRPAAGGANRGYVLPTMIAPEPHAGPMPHPAARPGRSDFTRIVSGRAILGDAPATPPPPPIPAAPAAAAPVPPAAPPSGAEAAKGSYLPLIIVLNVVLILAVGLVLYFALKR